MKKFGTGITYRDPQYWLRTEVRYGVNIRVIRVQIASKIRKIAEIYTLKGWLFSLRGLLSLELRRFV
jgi:hypothetical protein